MQTNIPPVATLLHEAIYWNILDDERLTACMATTGGVKELYTVDTHDMAKCHPLLPSAIKLLAQHQAAKGDSTIIARHKIRDTLCILQTGGIEVTNTSGSTKLFTKLTSVTEQNQFPDVLMLSGILVTVNTGVVAGQPVPYVVNSTGANVYVKYADLDHRYPGWHERMRIGHDLALDPDTILQQTFTNNPQPGFPCVPHDLSFE